jgi:hypothetical protein
VTLGLMSVKAHMSFSAVVESLGFEFDRAGDRGKREVTKRACMLAGEQERAFQK